MAIFKSIILYSTGIYCSFYLAIHSPNLKPVPEPLPEKNVYEVFDSLCIAQNGIKELTGNNDGKWINIFLKSTGAPDSSKWAWCAAIVNHNLKLLKDRGYNVLPLPKNAYYSPSWAKNPDWKKGQPMPKYFKKGDVATIYFSNLKRPAHTLSIYEDDGGSSVKTFEGNTSDDNYGQKTREGNKATFKRRLKKQLYTVKSFIKD